jgi:hypothetical protein
MSKPSTETLIERAKDQRAAHLSRLLTRVAASLTGFLRRLTTAGPAGRDSIEARATIRANERSIS